MKCWQHWGYGPWEGCFPSLSALGLLAEMPQMFRDRWVFLRPVESDGDRVGGDIQGREIHPFGASLFFAREAEVSGVPLRPPQG